MADYFTHFSCIIDVCTADKAARALALFQDLRAAEQEADEPEFAGLTLSRQDAPEGSTLWIHDDEHGDVEAVIRFVLRLADALDLTGLWGLSMPYAEFGIRHIMPGSGLCRMAMVASLQTWPWPCGHSA